MAVNNQRPPLLRTPGLNGLFWEIGTFRNRPEGVTQPAVCFGLDQPDQRQEVPECGVTQIFRVRR